MTKAEIKTALEAKFDKVGDWQGGFPAQLDIARYDIVVFNFNEGFSTYSVFVENDGLPAESATFGSEDPTADAPVSTPDFRQKVLDEIQTRVDASQIEAGLVINSGDNVAEVSVYTLSGQDVSKTDYIVYEKTDGSLGFRKLV